MSDQGTPGLPVELVHLIIDHLRNDTAALSACSLVCKAWISRCRLHLMSDHSIGPHSRRTSLDPSLLAQYTRNLLLSHLTLCTSWPEETKLFTTITTLYLMWSGVDSVLRTHLTSTFTLVTHLELRNNHFEDLVLLASTICSLPMLECLTLVKCRWGDEYAGEQAPAPCVLTSCVQPPKRWRSLSVQLPQLDEFLTWFNSFKPAPSIAKFCVDTLEHPSHLEYVGFTIASLGPSLQHLTIVLTDTDNLAAKYLNLQYNSNLRDLKLLVCPSFQLLVNLLESHQPHTDLREISITASRAHPSGWTVDTSNIQTWRNLDRLIVDLHTKARFSKLTIRVQRGRNELSDLRTYPTYMPESTALRIVQFVTERQLQNDRNEGLIGHARFRWEDKFAV